MKLIQRSTWSSLTVPLRTSKTIEPFTLLVDILVFLRVVELSETTLILDTGKVSHSSHFYICGHPLSHRGMPKVDIPSNSILNFGFLLSSEWDDVGAVVKSKLRQEQLQNSEQRLQSVEDVVRLLEQIFSERASTSYEKWKDSIF